MDSNILVSTFLFSGKALLRMLIFGIKPSTEIWHDLILLLNVYMDRLWVREE